MPKITEKKPKPGLVNRQAVGTYQGKLHQRSSGVHGKGGTGAGERRPGKAAPSPNGDEALLAWMLAQPRDRISPDLRRLPLVPLGKLVHDPANARLHPERNLESIMHSLASYGQRSNITVNRRNMHVEKGNGTLEAARRLGWTKLAVSFEDDPDHVAAGYGLADNKTAELARWDFEVVARLDKLMAEAGESRMVGWTAEEIAGLRGQFQPPGEFQEVDESIEVEHECPKCGYQWSGGE